LHTPATLGTTKSAPGPSAQTLPPMYSLDNHPQHSIIKRWSPSGITSRFQFCELADAH
jgi:hypothetical protein